MPLSSTSPGRGDFDGPAYPISITFTIDSYVFASTPTGLAPANVILFQNGSYSEIAVNAFVTPEAWPPGLTAGPAPGRLGWLQVEIYGGPSMLSGYSALPSSFDTADVQEVYGWINPDFQTYENAISYSANDYASAPEPGTVGLGAIGGALMLFTRRWMQGKRRN